MYFSQNLKSRKLLHSQEMQYAFSGYTKQNMSANYLLLSCSLPQNNSTTSSVNKRLPSLGGQIPHSHQCHQSPTCLFKSDWTFALAAAGITNHKPQLLSWVVVEAVKEFNKELYQNAMSRVLIKRERAHSRHTNPLLNRTSTLHNSQ
jgi:hypothetical protein